MDLSGVSTESIKYLADGWGKRLEAEKKALNNWEERIAEKEKDLAHFKANYENEVIAHKDNVDTLKEYHNELISRSNA